MADLGAAPAPRLVAIPELTVTPVSSPVAESVVLQWLLAALAAAEADTVEALHHLNAEALCALARSDAGWFRECLTGDFVCTLAEGQRLDRADFLLLIAERRPMESFASDEVDVRPLGELGIVHGVLHTSHEGSGSATSVRFTHVWLVRDGRWQLAAAHLSRISD